MVRQDERRRIGIDLGGTKIEAILLDASGAALGRVRVGAPRGDYDATVRAIVGLVEELESGSGAQASVGVGTPGAISPATGRIKNSNSVWLNGRPLGEDLARALSREVRLANDADCFALSEATDGAAAGAPVVFGAILGTGVGGGIVARGRLISGPNAIAGEWGHNALPWPRDDERPGPDCYCGRRGCIETFVSGPGLERDHAERSGAHAPAAEVVARAASGEALANETLERYAERLARALASLINLLDPHVIVLGGGLSNIPQLYARVPALWSSWVFSDRVDTRLVPPRHGDSSGVRGAAWLWEP
jgi:fructokinase